MTETELIRDAIDLSTWEEAVGYGSIHGPICPYCGEVFPTAYCFPSGLALCPHCAGRFAWRSIESPAGQAWITRTCFRRKHPTAAIHLYGGVTAEGTVLAHSAAEAIEGFMAFFQFVKAEWTVQTWLLGSDGRSIRQLATRKIVSKVAHTGNAAR